MSRPDGAGCVLGSALGVVFWAIVIIVVVHLLHHL